jgi:hypothetical protein
MWHDCRLQERPAATCAISEAGPISGPDGAPLSDLDFALHPWVPQSGWPLSKQDLDPYYVRAQEVCELGAYRYDSDKAQSFPAFDRAKIATGFWRLSPPTRFGSAYREELDKARNIRVYLYANVAEIEVNENCRLWMAKEDGRGRAM